jgi:hypothetical protein
MDFFKARPHANRHACRSLASLSSAFAIAAVLLLGWSMSARAEALKAAVFDFELVDTSLEGEMKGARGDEHDRLVRTGEVLRKRLAESGKFVLVDTAPLDKEVHGSNLQNCGGCDVTFARALGADISVTGVVQKVSNLILNMNIYLRDTKTGAVVTAMSADFRGNTDESWARALDYLLRNKLLAPNYGMQP